MHAIERHIAPSNDKKNQPLISVRRFPPQPASGKSTMYTRYARSDLRSHQAIVGAVNALTEALGFGVAEPGNEFRGSSLFEIGQQLAIRAGRTPAAVASPASVFDDSAKDPTYNDLDQVIAQVAERALIDGFETGPSSWRDWTSQSLITTFTRRPRKRVLGFDLSAVPEGAQIPVVDAPSEDRDTNAAKTKGCIIRMSRAAFINGDMRFVDLARAAGRAAAIAVNSDVYSTLTANAVLADGGPLFNSTSVATPGGHANAAGSGGAVAAGTLQAAKAAIRAQAGAVGSKALFLRPRFLLVPGAIEDTAWAAMATPFGLGEPGSGQERAMLNAGRLQLISDPSLDLNSATAWYVAADPVDAALVEVAFVGTDMRPRVVGSRKNFDTDSRDVCVTFDFGVTAGNWRAGYRNPGA